MHQPEAFRYSVPLVEGELPPRVRPPGGSSFSPTEVTMLLPPGAGAAQCTVSGPLCSRDHPSRGPDDRRRTGWALWEDELPLRVRRALAAQVAEDVTRLQALLEDLVPQTITLGAAGSTVGRAGTRTG